MNRRKFIKCAAIASGLIYVPTRLARAQDDGALLMMTPPKSGLITAGMAFRWAFTEGSGSSVADSSGNAHTGTLTSSPTWGSGPFSGLGSVTFDGGGTQRMTTSGTTGILDNLTTGFSVCCFFKTTNNQSGQCGGIIMSKCSQLGADTPGWDVGMGNFDDCGGGFIEGGVMALTGVDAPDGLWYTNNRNTSTTYNDGAWHHLAMVVNSTSSISLYLDGSTSSSVVFSSGPCPSWSNALNICIGAESGGHQFFNGAVSDARGYTRTLSSAEVSAIKNGTG